MTTDGYWNGQDESTGLGGGYIGGGVDMNGKALVGQRDGNLNAPTTNNPSPLPAVDFNGTPRPIWDGTFDGVRTIRNRTVHNEYRDCGTYFSMTTSQQTMSTSQLQMTTSQTREGGRSACNPRCSACSRRRRRCAPPASRRRAPSRRCAAPPRTCATRRSVSPARRRRPKARSSSADNEPEPAKHVSEPDELEPGPARRDPDRTGRLHPAPDDDAEPAVDDAASPEHVAAEPRNGQHLQSTAQNTTRGRRRRVTPRRRRAIRRRRCSGPSRTCAAPRRCCSGLSRERVDVPDPASTLRLEMSTSQLQITTSQKRRSTSRSAPATAPARTASPAPPGTCVAGGSITCETVTTLPTLVADCTDKLPVSANNYREVICTTTVNPPIPAGACMPDTAMPATPTPRRPAPRPRRARRPSRAAATPSRIRATRIPPRTASASGAGRPTSRAVSAAAPTAETDSPRRPVPREHGAGRRLVLRSADGRRQQRLPDDQLRHEQHGRYRCRLLRTRVRRFRQQLDGHHLHAQQYEQRARPELHEFGPDIGQRLHDDDVLDEQRAEVPVQTCNAVAATGPSFIATICTTNNSSAASGSCVPDAATSLNDWTAVTCPIVTTSTPLVNPYGTCVAPRPTRRMRGRRPAARTRCPCRSPTPWRALLPTTPVRTDHLYANTTTNVPVATCSAPRRTGNNYTTTTCAVNASALTPVATCNPVPADGGNVFTATVCPVLTTTNVGVSACTPDATPTLANNYAVTTCNQNDNQTCPCGPARSRGHLRANNYTDTTCSTNNTTNAAVASCTPQTRRPATAGSRSSVRRRRSSAGRPCPRAHPSRRPGPCPHAPTATAWWCRPRCRSGPACPILPAPRTAMSPRPARRRRPDARPQLHAADCRRDERLGRDRVRHEQLLDVPVLRARRPVRPRATAGHDHDLPDAHHDRPHPCRDLYAGDRRRPATAGPRRPARPPSRPHRSVKSPLARASPPAAATAGRRRSAAPTTRPTFRCRTRRLNTRGSADGGQLLHDDDLQQQQHHQCGRGHVLDAETGAGEQQLGPDHLSGTCRHHQRARSFLHARSGGQRRQRLQPTGGTCSVNQTVNVPVGTCTPAAAASGNSYTTTTCPVLVTGPTGVATCVAAAASSTNSWTATTCGTNNTASVAGGVLLAVGVPTSANNYTTTTCTTNNTTNVPVATCSIGGPRPRATATRRRPAATTTRATCRSRPARPTPPRRRAKRLDDHRLPGDRRRPGRFAASCTAADGLGGQRLDHDEVPGAR